MTVSGRDESADFAVGPVEIRERIESRHDRGDRSRYHRNQKFALQLARNLRRVF